MPEEQGVAGEFWTNEAVNLLTNCGWQQRGTTRRDIPCTACRPKNATPHGIDAVASYYNPFGAKDVGVIVETKNYGWRNLNKATIEGWVADLVKKLECVPQADLFADEFNQDGIEFNTGLLLIWCNTPEQYDWRTFLRRVGELDLPRRLANLRVFVASNKEIEQWRSMISFRDRLKAEFEDFSLFYPSVERSVLKKTDALSLELMYSRYVFAKGTGGDHRGPLKVSFVFLFEPATVEALQLAYVAAKDFQLEECDELRFFLYETDPQAHRGAIEGFLRATNTDLHNKQASYRLSIDFIPQVRGLA